MTSFILWLLWDRSEGIKLRDQNRVSSAELALTIAYRRYRYCDLTQ